MGARFHPAKLNAGMVVGTFNSRRQNQAELKDETEQVLSEGKLNKPRCGDTCFNPSIQEMEPYRSLNSRSVYRASFSTAKLRQ